MKIKIIPNNKQKIETELLKINKSILKYGYNSYEEIEYITQCANIKCQNLKILSSDRNNIIYSSVSGKSISKSYNYKRIANSIRIKYNNKNWYLISISRVNISTTGGFNKLFINTQQEEIILNNIKKQYIILNTIEFIKSKNKFNILENL